ncbi:MAG: cadherin-like domain-containing protein [Gemmataceae bacterium]|nr:cadherin-like domain-containing protein [Gemmataceae bacterium]
MHPFRPTRRPAGRTRTPLAVDRLEDRDTPAVVAAYAVTEDWGSGFQATVRLTNTDPAPVNFGQLGFTLAAPITTIWDAVQLSRVGDRYTVTNAGWNAVIPANGAAQFGFVASRGSVTPAPASNFVLDGVPLDGGGPALPTLSIADVAVAEGNSGTRSATFTITLSAAAKGAVTVRYATADGTARAGSDYTAASGTVTFAAGQKSKTVGVTVRGDTAYEPDETFAVSLSAPSGATIARATATGTIRNDDAAPPNRPPIAGNDTARTAPGQPVTTAVLTNDSDPDGDTLSVTAVGVPAHGSALRNPDGTVTYTPAAGYTGPDSFTYTLSDGRGGTATGTVSVTVAAPDPGVPSAWPSRVFAPYVDATLWPTFDFVAVARNQGVKFFTLAFITADPSNRPAWGGYAEYAITGTDFDTAMRANVATLRGLGGDVAVSFGGAAGRELAEVVTNVTSLTAAYRSVIQAYGLTHIDFDVEGAAVADKASIDRRNQAIATLQAEAAAAGKELSVRYTLPVLPTGLTPDGMYVLQSAKRYGVTVGVVNGMAMDYGDSAAPNPQGKMGDYAIQAGQSLFDQITQVWGTTLTTAQRWKMVGLTPMIGMNDIQTEIFDQGEAREVLAWAQGKGIGLLSFWSLNRDRQNPNGAINYVDLQSSSLIQTPFEFALIFNPFTG